MSMNQQPRWEIEPQLAAELAEKVAALASPAAYPEATAEVRCIETHMSWVFLTDRYAYKLKKPVRAPFLDFRDRQRRRICCDDELRLNRRLARSVYKAVVPLRRAADGSLRVGGAGETVDHLVKMLRLPQSRMLDTALAHGTLLPFDIAAVVETLVRFYRQAERANVTAADYRSRFGAEIERNRRALAERRYGLPLPLLEAVSAAQRRFADGDLLAERVAAGHVVDGHGDLRPEHVYLGPPVQIIDCLEFDRGLRLQDTADELAFLALECERLGSAHAGETLLADYCRQMNDPVPRQLLRFYRCFRACSRAKLAAWHIDDPAVHDHAAWHRRALDYLLLAYRAMPEC